MATTNLISSSTRLETPFILVTIGGVSFGVYSKQAKTIIDSTPALTKSIIATYPNFIRSLTVNKINGVVNTYDLILVYAIKNGDDPNLLDKIFSRISDTWTIQLSYGDLSIPNYIYKEENALISNIRSNVDFNSSTITYTLTCTSSSKLLTAGNYNFPKKHTKPSDEIKRILYTESYGMLNIFSGMRNKSLVLTKNLIASDDKPVDIEAKPNTNVFDYLNYLVTCMTAREDTSDSIVNSHKYIFTVFDDTNNEYGGVYFKVQKVLTNISANSSIDCYEIDVGYPTGNHVTGFNIENDQQYSILYKYNNNIDRSNYIYRIDNNGDIVSEYSPSIALSSTLLKTTQAQKTWWSQMTQFPISVSITLQGLLRPTILMSYVHLNTLFYGRKHISSGYYIITKQTDTIDAGGFKTTLKLTRVAGDSEYVN